MSMYNTRAERLVRIDGDGLNDAKSDATALVCKDPSLTKQSEKASCDINTILKRYEKTGILPDLIKQDPRYGDFSDMPTFQEAQAIVIHATAQFEALDAPLRKRFGNDPAEFLAFASDKANIDEMRKLGLLKPEPAKEASPAVAPDAKSEAKA